MKKQLLVEMDEEIYLQFQNICAKNNEDPISALHYFIALTLKENKLPIQDKNDELRDENRKLHNLFKCNATNY